MLDSSRQGNKLGYIDGLEGKLSRPSRKMPILKGILSSKFVRTYIEGYNKGHKQGTWEKERILRKEKDRLDRNKSKKFTPETEQTTQKTNLKEKLDAYRNKFRRMRNGSEKQQDKGRAQ